MFGEVEMPTLDDHLGRDHDSLPTDRGRDKPQHSAAACTPTTSPPKPTSSRQCLPGASGQRPPLMATWTPAVRFFRRAATAPHTAPIFAAIAVAQSSAEALNLPKPPLR